MKSDNRPLSPHLQVYKWETSMAMSILHRVSGVGSADAVETTSSRAASMLPPALRSTASLGPSNARSENSPTAMAAATTRNTSTSGVSSSARIWAAAGR